MQSRHAKKAVLISLATLASPVFAQSSVTLYGIVDDSIAYQSSQTSLGSTKGGCSNINVGLRLDLTGAIDDGGQVLTDGFACGDFGDAGLSMDNATDDDACQNQDDRDDYNNLFSAHCCFL